MPRANRTRQMTPDWTAPVNSHMTLTDETCRAVGELPAEHPPVKIQKVGVLIVNGAVLGWAERLARQTSGSRGWPVLATVSTISLFFWLTVLGLGTWLRSVA